MPISMIANMVAVSKTNRYLQWNVFVAMVTRLTAETTSSAMVRKLNDAIVMCVLNVLNDNMIVTVTDLHEV